MDLAMESSVAGGVEACLELTGGKLWGVVNNAGVAQYGAVEDLSRDAIRNQFEVNVFGGQDLTNRLIPLFRKQGFGRIVNVSSVYGLVTAPLVGCYCASKYAVEAFSDAMRLELCRAGITVSLIEPGQIISAFRSNAARLSQDCLDFEKGVFGKKYARKFKKAAEKAQHGHRFAKPPEAVAAKICHALESKRPRTRYYVTLPAYLAAIMRRFTPTKLVDRLLLNSAKP
jgi:short-subunit dehydrogenase